MGIISDSFFLSAYFSFMPESSRWLIQKQRYNDAMKVLKFVARLNGKSPPDMPLLLRVGYESKAQAEHRYSFLDLFRTKKYAAQTMTVMTGW
jgi:hypothetical protein